MKVLYVAPNIRVPGTNGGSTHTSEVMLNLRRGGDTVLVLARVGSNGPMVVPLGLGNPDHGKHLLMAATLPLALYHARRFRPDVIYERFSASGLGAVLSRVLDVPLVTMVLEYELSPLSKRWADRLVTTRPALLPAALQPRVAHVHWGANEDHFRPDAGGDAVRRKLGLEGRTVIGYTGAFYEWHGLERLVEAAGRLGRKELRFLLVGDGRVRKQIEQRAAAAGLAGQFLFPGRVSYSEIPAYVSACDVCVAAYEPRLHEATERSGDLALDPLKIFEYLAAGRPVVVSDTRNVRDLFQDPAELRMVPPGDAAALARVLGELLDRPEETRAMAQRGRERVLAQYTWRRHTEHLHRIFEEVITERRRPR